MRRLVVSQFVTADGVMEGPGGEPTAPRGGWAFQFERGEEGDDFKREELWASDALLLGRVTYEGFAAAWPGRSDEAGFADKFNSMRKYVVSSTLSEPLEWNNSHLLKGDVAEAVRELKQGDGGDIIVLGSSELAQTLIEHGLIDVYDLWIEPIVLGKGKRLFREGLSKAGLKLVKSEISTTGVAMLTYEPGPIPEGPTV